MVISAGGIETSGAVLSTTKIFCTPVATPPQLSIAVQVLTKVNSPAQSPAIIVSTLVNGVIPQPLKTVGVSKEGIDSSHSTVLSVKAEILGGKLFFNLKRAVLDVEFPHSSVAVK